MMTIKDLVTQLLEYPPDLRIVLSKDGEGNSYSPLSDLGLGLYVADSTWSGEMYDLGDPDFQEDDPDTERVLVFWPVN